MKIDRTNYEQYLMDYLEGRLNKAEEASVRIFLSENPDIAEEFSTISEFESIADQPSEFLEKANLYRSFNHITSITEKNFEEFCIAYYEGDLDQNSKQKLLQYVEKTPKLQSLFSMHGQIHVYPDTSIHYPGKQHLKKLKISPFRKIMYYTATGIAAASVVLIFWLTKPGQIGVSNESTAPVAEINGVSKHDKAFEIPEIVNTDQPETSNISIQNNKENKGILLAKIDTSDTRQPDKIVLASIDSKPPELDIEEDEARKAIAMEEKLPVISAATDQTNKIKKSSEKSIIDRKKILRRTLINGAMKIGIRGFNSLTESQLAVRTSKDDNGRLTAIAIDGENFEFVRKMQHNNQN